jgi:hypothetical protein
VTAATYLEQFQNLVEVATHTGASAGLHAGIVIDIATKKQIDLTPASRDETIATQAAAEERFLETSFLLNSDRSRYGRLIEEIENTYIQGQNRYPLTVTAAYNLLVNWKQDPRNVMQSVGPSNDGCHLPQWVTTSPQVVIQTQHKGEDQLLEKGRAHLTFKR